jgi:broad specificity phosphatase PhoE
VTTIELVRHAKAHSRDRWWGKPDRERPLNPAGEDQSRSLARALRQGAPIAALYSSPFARCTQTLDPLSVALGLPVVGEEALAEVTALPPLDDGDGWVASAWLAGRALAFVDSALEKHDGERIVACTHGDVIPALLALLAGRDGLAVQGIRLRKGGRFSLTFDGRRCVVATPFPAPAERTRG